MRLPRVRFTVRRMMIAVAVVALAFGIVRLWGLPGSIFKRPPIMRVSGLLCSGHPRPSPTGSPDGRPNARDCPRNTRGQAELRSCRPWPGITMQ